MKTHRILLVDDEEVVRSLGRRVLSGPAYDLRLAGGVAEALALLAQQDFDLLITDWRLPYGSGGDIAKAFRRKFPGAPCILLTGFLDTDDFRAKTEGLAFAASFQKPLTNISEFVEVVDGVLRRGGGGVGEAAQAPEPARPPAAGGAAAAAREPERAQAEARQPQAADALVKAEAELRETKALLELSNKEAAQFAYIASHDLKAPLRSVTCFGDLLAKHLGGQLDAKGREYLDFMTGGARRCDELVSALYAYSKLACAPQERWAVSAQEALQAAMDRLGPLIKEKAAKITWDTLPEVSARGNQLAQVFQALLSNALIFNSSGAPEIQVSCRESRAAWTFAVADNGIGIPEDQRERVFMVFQSLHPHSEYPGVGMGLAVCRRIAELHGGRAWVEARPAGGSVFFVEIAKPGALTREAPPAEE